MKCIIIFLSLVALGYAVPLNFGGKKHITLDEDDTITIHGSLGKKLVISKVRGFPGQRNVEVFMEDLTGPTKKIWFKDQGDTDDTESQDELTEADILAEILQNYQGTIDDDDYEDILKKIRKCVQTGHVDVAVLDILRNFDSKDEDEDTNEEKSLQELKRQLKRSGLGHKTSDLGRLVKDKLSRQESLLDIDEDDQIYQNALQQKEQDLKRLLQKESGVWTHKRNPFSFNSLSRKHQGPILFTRQRQETSIFHNRHGQEQNWEDVFDRKVEELEKKQERFTKPALYKFKYGGDQDDDRSQNQVVLIGGKKFIVPKSLGPALLDDEIAAQKYRHLRDLLEEELDQQQEDQDQRLGGQDDIEQALQAQIALQQRNPWQQRFSQYLNGPRNPTFNDQRGHFQYP